MLNRGRVAHAMAAPSPRNDQKTGSWSCGPNSRFRALRCFGEPDQDYDSFVEDCPRVIERA